VADEPSWDEIFSSQPGVQPPRAPQPAAPQPGSPQTPAASPTTPLTRRELREAESARESAAAAQIPLLAQAEDQPRRRSTHQASTYQETDQYGLPPAPKRKRRLTWLWALLSVIVLLGAGGAAVYVAFGPQIRSVLSGPESNDYTGGGTGKVVITISNGQIGSDVAKTLVKDGVTKSYDAFYKLLLSNPDVSFQPGSYALKNHMSAKAALAALIDPANKVTTQVSLPEGITVKGVIAKLGALSESTGVTADQLTAASTDLASFGLPADAPSLEGYLFPATYTFDPGVDAHAMLQTMVTKMFSVLDAAGVAPADRNHVLTLAALTQKEGGSVEDFYKVARVWDNRIDKGMHLQSDATVSYGAGTSSINTTPAQRADASNKYNTYANPGLPIGPISNPGEKAIDATLHPAEGDWLYFVVVNCSTGQSEFSNTYSQHQAAIGQLDAWLKANPGGCD